MWIAASIALAGSLDIEHKVVVLDNGLTVLLHQDRRLPLVAVSVWRARIAKAALEEVEKRRNG